MLCHWGRAFSYPHNLGIQISPVPEGPPELIILLFLWLSCTPFSHVLCQSRKLGHSHLMKVQRVGNRWRRQGHTHPPACVLWPQKWEELAPGSRRSLSLPRGAQRAPSVLGVPGRTLSTSQALVCSCLALPTVSSPLEGGLLWLRSTVQLSPRPGAAGCQNSFSFPVISAPGSSLGGS